MNFEDIVVKIDKPYPEIVNATDDRMTVAILKNLVNSRIGELTATLTYIYQSVVADKINEDIAEIFEEIGIVEMIHQDLLMHAICDFGGNPRYEDAQGKFYNTGVLNYNKKLVDMLNDNISAEKYAVENYKEAIRRIGNESLKKLFARIIEDEERHIEIFNKIKNNVEFLSI